MSTLLLKDIDWQGVMIFTAKEHWLDILNNLRKKAEGNPFFFFFDNERGSHLKVFFKNNKLSFLDNLEKSFESYEKIDNSKYQDPIFPNFEINTIHRFQYISENSDIQLPEKAGVSLTVELVSKISNIIIGALGYNSFFLEEKNRVNFALQLAFLSPVRKSAQEKAELLNYCTEPEILNIDHGLLEFYEEIQTIESEDEPIEYWVKSWIGLCESNLNLKSFDFIFDLICQILEIRDFSEKVKNTLLAAIKSELGEDHKEK